VAETTDLEAQDDPAPAPKESLIRRAARGGVWVVAGHVFGQSLRLVSNLILTRLLFPEAFGLMALVHVVLQGVSLFSDVGLRASVVQHARGEEPEFLDTVWSVQIVRGILISAVVALLATPMASFYDKPELLELLIVVGLTGIIQGLASTSLGTLTRRVQPGRIVAMELASQIAALAVNISWALLYPTVWALVGGALTQACLLTLLSHAAIPGYRNRIRYEPAAMREIIRFGRWILISTAFTFFMTNGDRLALGKLMTAGELGVYTIAFFPAQLVITTIGLLATRVLFPVYARLSSGDPKALRRETTRMRAALMGVMLPALWLLALAGPEIVALLYDDRYHEAGWMLQILAVGAVGRIIGLTAESIMLARGKSFQHMLLQIAHAGLLFGCMAIRAMTYGVPGVLVGMSVARILAYLPLIPILRDNGVWLPALDAAAFGVSALVIGGGLFLRAQL
jgi:O-antigen/teichoic acid export membrane protein